MLKRYFAIASLILVMALIATTACAAPAAQPVSAIKTLKVGNIMPFTGQAALWGQNIRPGMEIYAQLINEDGGLKIGNDTYKVEMSFVNPEKVILNNGTIGGRDPAPPEKSYVFYGFPQTEMVMNQVIATMQAFPQYHTLAWTGMRSGDQTPEAMFKPTDDKLLKDFGIK
ncbi:MAG: hypothetical protein ABSA18_09705, partial [Dehalococcoidia bacterium]